MQAMAADGAHRTPARTRTGPHPQPAYDPLTVLRDHDLHTPAEVVDFFAQHLLAVPLTADCRQTLVDFLASGGPLDPLRPAAAQRVRTLVQLLCSTPEYQLN